MTEKQVTAAVESVQNVIGDKRMVSSIAKMEQIIDRAASLVILLEGRLREAEAALSQRVTVSGREAQNLTRAVQSRARAICDDAGADYRRAGEITRRAIYRAIREEYGIETIYDLPQARYSDALESIRRFRSFSLLKRIRAIATEGSNSS